MSSPPGVAPDAEEGLSRARVLDALRHLTGGRAPDEANARWLLGQLELLYGEITDEAAEAVRAVLAEAGARAVLAELAELAALPADPEAPAPPAPEVPRPPETPEDCGARPWTVAELAATCSVSVSYVRKCIKVGSLEAHRLGRVVRISAPEARRFAADLGVMPLPLAHQTHDAHGAHQTHTVKLKLAERKASA